MQVVRWTMKAKVGCKRELVALLKEAAATIPDKTVRIYTYRHGPLDSVVWEIEDENMAEHERAFREWAATPFASSFFERLNPLQGPGAIEELLHLE